MRIEAIISVIFAFCCVISILFSRYAAAAANNLTFNYSRRPRKMSVKDASTKKMSHAETQHKLEESDAHISECCPSIVEMVEPVGGRNVQNMYVELYRDGNNAQRFYETSCRSEVIGKPCKFVDHRLKAQSRCVQLYSYTYAIVKNKRAGNTSNSYGPYQKSQSDAQFDGYQNSTSSTNTSPWALDYIEVRSGCACKIFSKRILKLRTRVDDMSMFQSHIKINSTYVEV